MTRIAVLILSLILVEGCSSNSCDIEKLKKGKFAGEEVSFSKALTIHEVETSNSISLVINGVKEEFSYEFSESNWNKFKEMYKGGDCIHYFLHGNRRFTETRIPIGRAGFFIVRKGEIVGHLITGRWG